eukprot:5524126-Prorocentrum_lima.AAC.1
MGECGQEECPPCPGLLDRSDAVLVLALVMLEGILKLLAGKGGEPWLHRPITASTRAVIMPLDTIKPERA